VNRWPRTDWMKNLVLLTILLTCTAGCLAPMQKLENVRRLADHPEFPAAAEAAPEFTREALKTVAELEYELERR